jgi:DNA (cytosine-5)-methyltransferase 1
MPHYHSKWGGYHEVKIMDNRARERELIIPEATVKGFAIARENDSIDFTYMNSKTRRGRVSKDVAHTIMTSCAQGTLTKQGVRRLTPRECWRLMGFDDEDFDKAREVNSDTQLYKQAGNSIVVNVLEEILKPLLRLEESNVRN